MPPTQELLEDGRVRESSPIVAGLHLLPSGLLEQTRAGIRAKERPTRQRRVQSPGIRRLQMLRSQQSSPIATSLQAFPSELVEKTRERIRAESRLVQDVVLEERPPRVKRPRVQELSPVKDNSWTRLRLLEEEHLKIAVASEAFPPIITPSILRKCTKEYYQILETGFRWESCASCGVLWERASLFQVTREEPYISANLSYLDRCGIKEGLVTLCNECKVSLLENKVPKFSGRNFMNTTLCQAYPLELEGLTYIEECVIALAHPIGAIIKLTGGGRSSGIEYRGSRGHFITFKQDPSQLSTILPSSALELHKYVTISWAGLSKPTPENLMAFCRIEKARVLRALVWLVRHNPLYANISIDYNLLASWEERFVPEVLIQTANITEDNWELDQREGYTTSLEGGSYENDFDALHEEVDPGTVIGGSFLSDEEGQNQSKQMAFIAKLTELVREQEEDGLVGEPHIEFSSTVRVRIWRA